MLIYWRRVSLQKDELWGSSLDLTGKSWNVIKTLLFLIGRRNPWEVLDNLRSSTEHAAFQVKSKHGRKMTKIHGSSVDDTFLQQVARDHSPSQCLAAEIWWPLIDPLKMSKGGPSGISKPQDSEAFATIDGKRFEPRSRAEGCAFSIISFGFAWKQCAPKSRTYWFITIFNSLFSP